MLHIILLMVCKIFPKEKERGKKAVFVSKCKIWKLKVAETQKEYEKKVYDREEKRIETTKMLKQFGRS